MRALFTFSKGLPMQTENFYGLAQKLLLNHNGKSEIISDLVKTKGGRVELIVSTGQTSPPGFYYNQNEDEWVMVLQGRAVVEADGTEHELNTGDSLFLPKGQQHRVCFTSSNPPCLWLAVFWR